jgi:hypothetical protein
MRRASGLADCGLPAQVVPVPAHIRRECKTSNESEALMYTDEQIHRDLERYLNEARRMRSEYLASLFGTAFGYLTGRLKAMVQRLRQSKMPGKGSFARR